MRKVRLKKALTMCIVSALIASSTGTMAFAVDTSETVSDNSVVVSEGDESSAVQESESEDSNNGGTEEQSSETETSKVDQSSKTETSKAEQSSKTETSRVEQSSETETSKVDQSSKTETSRVEQSSVSQESSSTELEGEQTIYFLINFDGNFGKAHASTEMGYIDYSNVKFTVYTADKKKSLGTFSITDDMYYGEYDNGETACYGVRVPEWKNGSKYIVAFSNLPSIYKNTKQECVLEYSQYDCILDNGEEGIFINGISKSSAMRVDLERKDFNALFYTYDMNGNPISNAVVSVKGYNEDDTLIYSGEFTSNSEGIAIATIDAEDAIYITAGITNVVNNELMGGAIKAFFNYISATYSSPESYVLQTDTSYEDTLLDEDGNTISTACNVPFTLIYKDNSNVDMSLFEWGDINVGIYSNKNLVQTFTFNSDRMSDTLTLTEGYNYTINSIDCTDYKVDIDNKTLKVSDGASVNITATPQLTLKIINKADGKNSAVKFSINGTEYSGDESYSFAVNGGTSFTVINLDNGDEFMVSIGDYKETVLNIASGDIEKDGYVGVSDDTTSSSGTNGQNEEVGVPQTGDTILTIVLIIIGTLIVFGTGFIYFKKKGSKLNESKK